MAETYLSLCGREKNKKKEEKEMEMRIWVIDYKNKIKKKL